MMSERSSQPSESEVNESGQDRLESPPNASSSDDSISTHVGTSGRNDEAATTKTESENEPSSPPKLTKPRRRAGKGNIE